MSELLNLLCGAIEESSSGSNVALLLSAGIDSVSVGIACQEVGKTVHAYTYELHGVQSMEREKTEAIARHFGWPLTVVTAPTTDAYADFLRLAVEHRCKKKVHFEVTFPLLYAVPEIHEMEIWTGWNADDHYGNNRRIVLEQARLVRDGVAAVERKARFDEYRKARFEQSDAQDSADTYWFASKLATHHGMRLLDPYRDNRLRTYFEQFDHQQLSSLRKPFVREALAGHLKGLPDSAIAKGVRLQKGGRVDELFRDLLANPEINRFATKYTTVSALCQKWGREVEADPEAFAAEVGALPPRPRAKVRLSGVGHYRPYLMNDVIRASEARAFNVISTFAGGGGSSTGYRLAGGIVLAASEFVPEAARTYRKNFPDCYVDERDIREISTSDARVAEFLSIAGLKPGELDVLDGSPPCCEFSLAGSGISDQDVMRVYSDVKQNNIATLPFDFIDLALRARPKVVIMENVPAFASRGKEVFERLLQALRFLCVTGAPREYFVNYSILAASDFGVPQKRNRLFIIGVRHDVGTAIGIDSAEAVLDVFPSPTQVGVNIRSALADLAQTERDIAPWTRSAMVSSLGAAVRRLPKQPSKLTRLNHVIPGNTKRYMLTRCSWDLPAPTLAVTGQRPDGLTGAIHPEKDRKFTLPELKRLTALPDDFVLTGTLGQAAERVCRMVPPLLTKAIAESVYAKVLRPFKETTHERR
jgi:DNA-cytosine methyltransferase